MARTRTLHATRLLRRQLVLLDRHHFIPIFPIVVFDGQREGRTEREAMAHAAEDLDAIVLDLHAPAASVALLSAPQFTIEQLNIDRQASGQAFDNRDERATV